MDWHVRGRGVDAVVEGDEPRLGHELRTKREPTRNQKNERHQRLGGGGREGSAGQLEGTHLYARRGA